MTNVTKIFSIMNKKILTSINITVYGRDLGSRKTTANHAYTLVGNLPLL